jgi:hypothetical protein
MDGPAASLTRFRPHNIGVSTERLKVAALMFALLLPLSSRAESLADAAKREKERREHNKETGVQVREIGPEEMAEYAEPSKPTATGTRDGGNAPRASSSSDSGGTTKSGSEAYWRGRVRSAQAAVDHAQKAYDSAMNETPFTGPTDAWGRISPANVRATELRREAARTALEAAKKAQSDLAEEARQAGALPGWLR